MSYDEYETKSYVTSKHWLSFCYIALPISTDIFVHCTVYTTTGSHQAFFGVSESKTIHCVVFSLFSGTLRLLPFHILSGQQSFSIQLFYSRNQHKTGDTAAHNSFVRFYVFACRFCDK